MNGTQPMPLSTDTICSSGKRSKMPANTVLITTRALLMNNIEPPMAGFTYSSCDSQK